jgi:hypothetical protein
MAHMSIGLEQSIGTLRDVIDQLVGNLTVGQIYDDGEIMDYVLGNPSLLQALMERTKPIEFVNDHELNKWATSSGYIHESDIQKE